MAVHTSSFLSADDVRSLAFSAAMTSSFPLAVQHQSCECERTSGPRAFLLAASAADKLEVAKMEWYQQQYLLFSKLVEPSVFFRNLILFNNRRYGVLPINKARSTNGKFHHHIPELKQNRERFNCYFKMKIESSYHLFKIVKKKTNRFF